MPQKKYGQIIAKCWADEKFKKEFIKDPAKVLKENGLNIPEGMGFKVLENTEKLSHIIIPLKPSQELSDEQLDKAAGGSSCDSTAGTIGSICIATAGTAYSH